MNKPQLNLQDTFLNHARKENVPVTIYLVNSVQLRGNVRGFDSFTILLDTPGKPPQLVYKHSVTSIVPMRPIQNLFADLMRDNAVHAPTHALPAPAINGPAPTPAPADQAPLPPKLEPIA
ncbi:MAG: RNA chaperone Hfq [Capsulimonas sp.]|uniref:RNA chaperone Hfq n=1 Tax=Capsulimonas sp. TaxID=2494211 RepID=UPI003266082D